MTTYWSNDRGDRFLVMTNSDRPDERALGKVLRLNARQHEARRRICEETATELNRAVELLGEAVAALSATGVWREFNSAGSLAKPLPPSLRVHLEAKDPAVRHAARARHALMSAARALMAIAKGDTSDE